MSIANTPAPPYYAVIFTSTLTADDKGYGKMADAMERLASEQPGYLGIESARGPDGLGITISYWQDEEALKNWKQVAAHRTAQQLGKDKWYQAYTARVVRVERAYGFERD